MKIYAFIDSQNLNLGTLKDGWKLDFRKFRMYLRNKYRVEKAFLFIGYIKGNQKLYDRLERYGYDVIFKPVLKHQGKLKGNVDAELVLYAMIEFENYDKAIIVSGDGDFYCLEKYLYSQKKLQKIIVPNSRYSSLLREFANKRLVLELKNLEKNLVLKK